MMNVGWESGFKNEIQTKFKIQNLKFKIKVNGSYSWY
jgi:hypothetical protein